MQKIKDKIKNFLMILCGTALSAIASNMFYSPNKIVGGGVTGFAVILYHTFGIPLSVTLLGMNAVLFVAAFFVLGKQRIVNLTVGTVCYIIMTQLFSFFPVVTENLVLASVFGGALDGLGLALVFVAGGNTGGNDILAMMLQKKMKHLGVGRLIFIVDALVMAASLICFKKIELTLYGIMLSFISTFLIDRVIEKLNISKIAFIITDEGDVIAQKVIQKLERGVTALDGKGAYGGNQKTVLMCAMKNKEMPILQKLVEETDKNAFTIFSEAKLINGNGFKVYK